MSLVLGVDAGNTKTVAVVARTDGTIVGAGRAGCGDIYSVLLDLSVEESERRALGEIDAAVASALRAAGAAAGDLASGGFSLAGCDWPEDEAFLHAAMAARGYGRRIVVTNDALGALWAGTNDGVGVSVACGTGAAIGARAADGRQWHVGFWQEAMGADRMGRDALRAVYRAALGIDPPTTLTSRVLAIFQQDDVEAVLHLLTARVARAPATTGLLARALLDESGRGDAAAMSVVRRHAERLADYTLAAARRVGLEREPFRLVLGGGVLKHPHSMIVDETVRRVHETAPGAVPSMLPCEPVVGAQFMALAALGIAVDDGVAQRARASVPDAAFFTT